MAKRRLVHMSLKESTIPHEIICRHGGAKVLLRPASPGTGLIAGKTVRAVLELAGIKDVLSKSLGSNNPSNVVKATMSGLQQMRLHEDIYRARGLEYKPRPAAVPAPSAVSTPAAALAPSAPAPAAPVLPAAPAASVAPAAPATPAAPVTETGSAPATA